MNNQSFSEEKRKMKSKAPLVSICMPIFNEEKYLEQALESLLAQNFKDFELIISDNASTDRTPEICKLYLEKDNRIKYYRNERNIYALANFIKIMQYVKTPYFMFAGGHDLWSDNYIRSCLEIMEKDLSVVIATPRTVWIDENNKELDIKDSFIDTRGCGNVSRLILSLKENHHAIYGVIRSDALKKISWPRPQYIGTFLVMLGGLSLVGAFAHVLEATWYRRKAREDETTDQRLERYQRTLLPSGKYAKAKLSHWRIPYEYLIVIRRSPIPFKEKIALIVTVIPAVFVQYGYNMFGDIRRLFGKRSQ